MRFGIRLYPQGPCGAVLLEAAAQSFWLIWAPKDKKKGLRSLESWRAARDAVKHEPRSTASGSIGELIGRLVTLPEGP